MPYRERMQSREIESLKVQGIAAIPDMESHKQNRVVCNGRERLVC
jgi:hypothetical protein